MNDLRHDPDATPKLSDALAELREQYGAYFDAIPDVDAFVREQRSGGGHDLRTADQLCDPESYVTPPGALTVRGSLSVFNYDLSDFADFAMISQPTPDLRTADQRHADDLAALRTEIDDIKATLHKQAQMVQALWLEHELRERGA